MRLLLIFCFYLSLICPLKYYNPTWAENLELKIVSPHWDGYRREIESGFVDWYKTHFGKVPTIRWIDLGGSSDIGKSLIARARVKQPLPLDIIFGGGTDLFEKLNQHELLSPVELPPTLLAQLSKELNGNRLIAKDNTWFAVSLTSFGIVYNKIQLAKLNLPEPKTFKDLAKSVYRGLVGSADPRQSGSSRFMYELILQRYGWSEGWKIIVGISSNVRSFAAHASGAPKDITSGITAVSLLIDSYALELLKKYGSDRIGFVVPDDVFSFFGDPIAKLKTSNHPYLADKFIEFCLSEEGQSILAKKVGKPNGPKKYELARLPVNLNLYNQKDLVRTEKPFSEINNFRYDPVLASSRWQYLTNLIGALAVDLQPEIYYSRYVKLIDLDKTVDDLQIPSKTEEYNNEVYINMQKNRLLSLLAIKPASWWVSLTIALGICWLIKLFVEYLKLPS